jgi:hypothetical protein
MGNLFTDNLDDLKNRKPVYLCVVLTPDSQDVLRTAVTEKLGTLHKEEKMHHMTVVYKPSEEQCKSFEARLGSRVDLAVTGIGADDEVQAVRVVTELDGVANRVPHVTVAVAPGARPAKSNELSFEDWDGPVLKGTVMAFGNSPKQPKTVEATA